MLKVKVPRGWRREKIGNRICYESDPPRVKIWKVGDFDQLKIRGRFENIDRQELNFSSRVENDSSDESDNNDIEMEDDDATMVTDQTDQEAVTIDLQKGDHDETMETDQHLHPEAADLGLQKVDHDIYHSGALPHCSTSAKVQNQIRKVDSIVSQLTKDPASSLDHRLKLKEASSKLNKLRTSHKTVEVDLENLENAIKGCKTTRLGFNIK